MKQISIDRMVLGRDYYDIYHNKFKFINVITRPIRYIIQYDNQHICSIDFNTQIVYYEDIKEFKFGRKCSNLVEE